MINIAYAKNIKLRVIDELNQPIADVIITLPIEQVDLPPKNSKAVAIMDQIDKQFYPRVLQITAGQLVSFPNKDDIRHHVYSFSKAKPFEIGLYKNTPTEPIEFDQPGIVELGCNIHDKMLGYIYITDEGHTVKTNAQGEASVKLVKNQPLSNIKLWHPELSVFRAEHKNIELPKPNSEGVYELKITLAAKKTTTQSNTFKKKFGKK